MQLTDRIESVLAIDPGADAIESDGRWMTWGDIAAVGRDLDALLAAAGLGQGAPVAALLRTRGAHVAAFVELLRSRRCVVTVNPVQGDDKLRSDLESLRPAVVVASADDWERPVLAETVDSLGAVAVEISADPPGARLVGDRSVPTPGPRLEVPVGSAVQMLTSGTTGAPKRIPLRYAALEAALDGVAHHGGTNYDKPVLATGVRIIPEPMVHISGVWSTVTSLVAGRRMALVDRFRVDAWLDLVRRHRPKALSLVPASVRMVYDADVDPADLASLKAVTCGTAPLDPELQAAFEQRYGIPILIQYGATEFAGGVAGWTAADHAEWITTKRGSVGRANGGVELRIVDVDSGTPLGPDEVGILEARSAQLNDGTDWVRTTDLGRIDADGFLWITGRADGAIIRGGFKIIPGEVAEVLQGHPAVREASVLGEPDERLGQVPVAAVELHADAEPITGDELKAWAADQLTGYQVPVRIHVVDALPRTPSLKVSQPALRAMLEATDRDGGGAP